MAELSSTGDQMLVVLDMVARHGPMSAAEAAEKCDINRTVAHRLLATLAKHHYIARIRDGYVLGSKAYELASIAQPSIVTEGRRAMTPLAANCQETVVLHGIVEHDAIVLDQVVSDQHLVVVQHRPGARHPMYLGASGLSILAFLEPRTIKKTLSDLSEDLREHTLTKLDKVRSNGFALTHDELQSGVWGLAAPVFAVDGSCIASLAIIVPTTRGNRLEAFHEPLLVACRSITESLKEKARSELSGSKG